MKTKADQTEIFDLGKILIILIVIFMGIYLLTIIITGEYKKERKDPNTKPEVFIQYNEIIAGEIFSRPENEYYVIFYDFDSKEGGLMNSIVDNYINQKNDIKLYKVNLTNGFNKIIYDKENTNIGASTLEELKVNDVLLIKIEEEENVLQITEMTDIFAKLK